MTPAESSQSALEVVKMTTTGTVVVATKATVRSQGIGSLGIDFTSRNNTISSRERSSVWIGNLFD